MKKIFVAGAGGMIGNYMVESLIAEGHDVHAADIKPLDEWLRAFPEATNYSQVDLSDVYNALAVLPHDCDEVYNFAANMGGIGFIETEQLACIASVDITHSMLKAAYNNGARRFLQASSACAYPVDLQREAGNVALKESDAWKGRPEVGYGDEKLFGEALCEVYGGLEGFETRVVRYHNIYAGGYSTFEGGREKAPAAIARKVAEAVKSGDQTIEIWGDGEQTRSFCFIDDCIIGTKLVMRSHYEKPLNLGSDELVTINELVDLVEDIAGVTLERRYNLDAPQGVKGRNSDNTLIKSLFDWAPSISLRDGMEQTYAWVCDEIGV